MFCKLLKRSSGLLPALLLSVNLTAYSQTNGHENIPDINCAQCHESASPTPDNAALKPCPRLFVVEETAPHETSEAPDTIVLEQIVDQYSAVNFNHKLHAEMADMGEGCATCHHYSPQGKIPPCKECHPREPDTRNLRQPSLKGAYHRQCLACHREWSHDTDCVICHRENGSTTKEVASQPADDIIGIAHPVIVEPDKKVYHTPYEEGPVVTFYHKQHIELFGLRCVDCHKEESCGNCHDMQQQARLQRTQEEVHAMCNACHIDDSCDLCHGTEQKPAFSHEHSTGWTLGEYHSALDCRACHPTGKKIAALDPSCNNCHAGWNQENFDHAVTGLRLDELHGMLDCSGCHPERQFDQTPVCSDCHDDERTGKDNPPGEFVETGTE